MLPSRKRELLDELASNILITNDQNSIDNARTLAYFILQNELSSISPKRISYWQNKWEMEISPSKICDLRKACQNIDSYPRAIYQLFDCLRLSEISEKKLEDSSVQPVKRILKRKSFSTEDTILEHVFNLFSDKESLDIFQTIPISPPHLSLLKNIFKWKLSLNYLENQIPQLKGQIGISIRPIIDYEILNFSKHINFEANSLIEFISSLLEYGNRLESGVILCSVLHDKKNSSILNQLNGAQSSGFPILRQLVSHAIESCMQIILKFIRNWTVFGLLDDNEVDRNQFFIQKCSSKVSSYDWWTKKYVLVQTLIPFFLQQDSKIIHKILNSGRALNFISKYKNSYINYMNNFGSDAPFGLNFLEKKKGKKNLINPDVEWKEGEFNLSMVNKFYSESMNSLMYMIKNVIWIEGHLKTVNDFLLFGRGDFSSLLFKNFSENSDGDAATLLLSAIKGTTNGIFYKNKITDEIYTDRIDFKFNWDKQPSPDELDLVYLVNPPIDVFLSPDNLNDYNMIGNLIWKLKCAECSLGFVWKNMRRYEHLKSFGFDFRQMFKIRYLMQNTIKTMIEYMSTDIIICNWNKFVKKIHEINDFEELLQAHQEYLTILKNGSLLTQEYRNHFKLLIQMLSKISNFSLLIESLNSLYSNIIEKMSKPKEKTNKQSLKAFLEKEQKNIKIIQSSILKISQEFNDGLKNLYKQAFEDIYSNEMQDLEVRLNFIVINM